MLEAELIPPTALTRERVEGQASTALRVERLSYAVASKRLLDDLSFELTDNRITVMLGPNGAGKSLLLRLCHGLIEPTAGRIAWGSDTPAEARHKQAFVSQKPVLLRRSVAANVDYALGLHGISRRHREPLIADALKLTGLLAVRHRNARVLSGGEQQRLAIARACAPRPEVLLLDEPTAHLDPSAAHAVEQLIHAIHAAGTKIIMTTHDLGQAKRIAGEVLFLHRGRLLEQSSAVRFFSQPRSRAATGYLNGELLISEDPL